MPSRAGWMHAILCMLTAWAWLGSPRVAEAMDRGYGVVTLDLRPEGGNVPTHLCVVSEAQSPRARAKLWDVLESQPEPAERGGARVQSFRVRPQVWGGDDDMALQQRCTDEPLGDCRARVELPSTLVRESDLFVACTADSLTDGGPVTDPRPLFILLEYLEGSPPQIESVRLTGGIASIGVYGADFDRVLVAARSLGGHYLPQRRSERGQPDGREDVAGAKTIQLQLVPRCRAVEVRLPRTRIEPSDRARLSVRVHGMRLHTENERCVSNLAGTDVIQVKIPPAPMGVGKIDVELAATPDRAAARFGGSFEGAWPHAPFALGLHQITFSWRRPECIYPSDRCPSAVLENGTICSATITANGCDYRCPGAVSEENEIDLRLPLDVTFEKTDPNQRWHDKLAQNGQVLSSYVPGDQIYLDADLDTRAWQPRPDNRITKLEIYGEDGQARQYGVTSVERLVLKVPGASCEPMRFKPIGDRTYEEEIARVEQGELHFGDPQRSARRLNFNLTVGVGGGPAWLGGQADRRPPIYFSGFSMFAIQYRPRKPQWNQIGFELRLGGTLGQWARTITSEDEAETTMTMNDGEPSVGGSLAGEEPTTDDTDGTQAGSGTTSSSDREQRIGWARVLLEPGLVFSLHARVALGLGFGLGISLPFRSEFELTNRELNFIWSPNVDFRFRLRRWLGLVFQFRGIFGERSLEYDENLHRNDETPYTERSRTARSLLVLIGLQASF